MSYKRWLWIGSMAAMTVAGAAQTCNWTGAVDGFWTNANNWAEGVVPGRYYQPDGELTGGWQDSVIFGDNLQGQKVTTISFDGVYAISNLYTQGSSTRYVYGANAEEFIPIQCWGTFAGSRYADSLVPTIACKLRLGVECTDYDYGKEAPTIITENPNETLVIGPWGYRTQNPAYKTRRETGLKLTGGGNLQFDGAYNTGWGNYPQTTVAMSGGTITVNYPQTFRTLVVNSYKSSSAPTTFYIGENGSISSASSYNYLDINTPLRVYGPGLFKLHVSWQPTRGDGYGNTPGWFCSGVVVRGSNTFTLESPIAILNYEGATPERMAVYKTRMVVSGTGTFIKKDISYMDGEVMFCNYSWNSTDKRYYASDPGTAVIDAMGKCDNSVTGSLGAVDFLIGDGARLRHAGPGEWTDRSLILTGAVEKATGLPKSKATFEFAGTGTMTLASPVYCRGVENGTLYLENSTAIPAVADCAGGEGVDIGIVKGPWRFGDNFTCAGGVRVKAPAELTIDRSLTITNFYVDAGTGTATVFVKPGKTLAITNFTCASGATVDFQVLSSSAKVVAANRTVSGTVKVNGMAAKFNADGELEYADGITDHVWKWADGGSWTNSAMWLNGVPTASSYNSIVAPGTDYTVKVDGDELMAAEIGDAGKFTLTNLTVRNQSGGVTTLLVTNGAEMTLVSRASNASQAPFHLKEGSRLEIVDAKVILRDHGTAAGTINYISPLQNEGGDVEVKGNGELVCTGREGTAENAKGNQDGYYEFGSGHYVFRDNSKLRFTDAKPSGSAWSSVLYPRFRPFSSGDLKMEFLDNSCYYTESGVSYWTGYVGANGRHVELIFDTAYSGVQFFSHYFYIGCENGLSEIKFKRGNYRFGYYLTTLGSFAQDNSYTTSNPLFVTGRVEIASAATLLMQGWYESRAMTLGHGLLSTLQRGASCMRGEIVSAGTYTQERGSFVMGAGPCGEGVVHQTGGEFKPMPTSAADNNLGEVAVGIFGGRGCYTLDDGAFMTYRNVYIGGATTNDLHWSKPLKNADHLFTFHDAQGEVRVNGGTFTSSKSIILGADGTGTLALSGTGTVTAASIVVSNTTGQAASTLKFTSDAHGRCGAIAPTTTLKFASGAKLVVDVTANPEKRAKVLDLDTAPEGLSAGMIELVGDDDVRFPHRLEFSADFRKITYTVDKGMRLIFR